MDDDIERCSLQAGADLDSEPAPFRLRDGDQPLPVEVPGVAGAHELVIADLLRLFPSAAQSRELLAARALVGLRRYGQPLRPFAGRDSRRDAREEAADLVVYLKTMIREGESADDHYHSALRLLVGLTDGAPAPVLRSLCWLGWCGELAFRIKITERVPGQFAGQPHEARDIPCALTGHDHMVTVEPVSVAQYEQVDVEDGDESGVDPDLGGGRGDAGCDGSGAVVTDSVVDALLVARRLQAGEVFGAELLVIEGEARELAAVARRAARAELSTELADARRALLWLRGAMATSSANWGAHQGEALVYAVLVGWECEGPCEEFWDRAHTCDGTLIELAHRHGWSAEFVAQIRAYRAAIAKVVA